MDKIIKTLKKVIGDWDIPELIFVVILFPWSAIYIVFRMIQEWD
jgi:hypothetical protein